MTFSFIGVFTVLSRNTLLLWLLLNFLIALLELDLLRDFIDAFFCKIFGTSEGIANCLGWRSFFLCESAGFRLLDVSIGIWLIISLSYSIWSFSSLISFALSYLTLCSFCLISKRIYSNSSILYLLSIYYWHTAITLYFNFSFSFS